MPILRKILQHANKFGMMPSLNKKKRSYWVITALNTLSLVSIMVHTGVFYWRNDGDFDQVTFALVSSWNALMHLAKALTLLFKNDRLLRAMRKLKRLCHDPDRHNYQLSLELEKKFNVYTNYYMAALTSACFIVGMNPLVVKLLEYIEKGEVVKYRWEFPFPYASPLFEMRSSPAYEIVYVTFAIGYIQLIWFLAVVDVMFLAFCMHIYGLFKDLDQRLRSLGRDGQKFAAPQVIQELKKCIDFQNKIYDIIKDTQKVFANVFFFQIFFSIIVLCMHAYLTTQNLANGRSFSNVTFSLAGISELIIFTICGTFITAGQELLSDAIYDIDWFRFRMPAKLRTDFTIMLTRAQMPCAISFWNWIFCSPPSLRFVLSTSYNMYALFTQIAQRKNGK